MFDRKKSVFGQLDEIDELIAEGEATADITADTKVHDLKDRGDVEFYDDDGEY